MRLGTWARQHDFHLFWVLLMVVGAIGARWLWLYRHGQPYDIDECGYLSIALADYRGLLTGGLPGWWRAVMGPSVPAPLMTAATTPAFLIGGPNPIVGLTVPLVFGLVPVAATFHLGRRVGGRRVGWMAGLLALGAPLLLNYSRSYNFAIAATATMTLALLAFAQSDNLQHRAWSAALGLFIGLTALARTMTLAFLPALLVALVFAVAAGKQRKQQAGNAVIAVCAALAVAWPWYSTNGSRVYDYLTSFGYGSRASEYGAAESFFSFDAWRITAQHFVQSVYLPYLVLLAVGAAALIAAIVRGVHRLGVGAVALAAVRSPLMPSAVLVLGGLAALTSSRNRGSAFTAPLIPAMAVGAAWAVARLPFRIQRMVSAAAMLVVLVNVFAASDLGTPLARPRLTSLPVLGRTPISDGRGVMQLYEAVAGVRSRSAQPLSRREGQAWVAANAETAARIRASRGSVTMTAFGFRHRLLNVNSVQVENIYAGGPALPLTQVAPVVTTDAVEGYAAWLKAGDAATACNLLTANGVLHEFEPVVTSGRIEQAAEESGFVRTSSWTLPDGRLVSFWQRRQAVCP